jgi:hypothetical protein
LQHTLQQLIRLFFFSITVFVVTACGGGGGGGSGGDSPGGATATGVFLDSAVEGMAFTSGSITGITDADGTFQYEIGETVRFMIGDIVIGEALGQSIITPVNLVSGSDASHPNVVNIVSFLLTLDNDGAPENGIQITETVRNLAVGMSINFAQSTTEFADDGNIQVAVSQLTSVTSAGARSLVSSSFAEGHVSNTIWELHAGTYSGTFSGDDSGTFDVTLFTNGSVVGTGISNLSGIIFSTFGQMSTDGTVTFASGGTSTGASFTGTLTTDGVVSGTWQNGAESGTFSGSRTSTGGNTGGGTGSGTGGIYGSLTITGSSQVPSTFAPDASTGSNLGASGGFLQTLWSTIGTTSWTLSASIADDYQGLSGAKITFGEFGVEYTCESGFIGSYGDCSGATFDHNTRIVTFSNVQLQAPGFGVVITLDGTLNY